MGTKTFCMGTKTFCMGTKAFCMGTKAFCMGTKAFCLGTKAFCMGTKAFCMGTVSSTEGIATSLLPDVKKSVCQLSSLCAIAIITLHVCVVRRYYPFFSSRIRVRAGISLRTSPTTL